MGIGPAVWATALALALINLGLAALIAQLLGAGTLAPMWVVLAVIGVGVVLAIVAIRLWQRYIARARLR
ncbi:MAG: hypothetical protein NVSMB2_26760 [Chloroflexota bacterium]